jgi:hypothetical protein
MPSQSKGLPWFSVNKVRFSGDRQQHAAMREQQKPSAAASPALVVQGCMTGC